MAWLSFIELDKLCVRVIRLTSCLRLWFQSVCPLMPSLRAYHLTRVSLTLDVNQGKLEVVKQEMATVNINILGISKLRWTGMGEFHSDE